MAQKQFFRTIFVMVLLSMFLVGCASTPTPDPSIVWSDDFEDGDTEGWEDLAFELDNEYFVRDGVLVFGEEPYGGGVGGAIQHPSTVKTGTWSFDVFFPEDKTKDIEICISCDQDFIFGFGFNATSTIGMPNSLVTILTLDNGELLSDGSGLGRKLTGWNHFDVTRDESGNSKIYLQSELITEYKDDLTITSDMFYFSTSTSGPILDNVVIRNRVIEIQPTE